MIMNKSVYQAYRWLRVEDRHQNCFFLLALDFILLKLQAIVVKAIKTVQ